MASLPTSDAPLSRLSFLTPDGQPLAVPREWLPALIAVDISAADWEQVNLERNGQPLPIVLRRIGGHACVVAEWPRSGVGLYRLRLNFATQVEERTVAVTSEKLKPGAVDQLLLDLEAGLPANIALSLQRLGALAGLHLQAAGETTLAQEVARLRRAVAGTQARPGMAVLLPRINRDPYQRLQSWGTWTSWERARRPHPARLSQAVAAHPPLTMGCPPSRVLDTRVKQTVDVYENQIVQTYHVQVDRRLRRLRRVLAAPAQAGLRAEADALQSKLDIARRAAPFLDGVACPAFLPTSLTMVLQRRPEYRAILEGYLELHRSPAVRLEDARLDAPLDNLPTLYQTWGTLQIIAALLETATVCGYRVQSQSLAKRDAEGVFVRLLPDGHPVLTLVHPANGVIVRLTPERTYGATGSLRSISFPQRPDVAIEIIPPVGPTRIILFDPKYKLDSDGQNAVGTPLKADIDKMHAYCDAIRDVLGNHVVRSAHILYPGQTVQYGEGIGAVGADPLAAVLMLKRLQYLLKSL